MKNDVDVVVIGGGIIGLSLAYSLQNIGLRVIVVEKKLPVEMILKDTLLGLRVSSINIASEKFLIYLGVWSEILSHRANCYCGMEIWNRDEFGRINLENKKTGYNYLGHIIENKLIYQALLHKIEKCSSIRLIATDQVKTILFKESSVFISLKIGDIITTSLLIGADNANIWLHKQLNIPFYSLNYCQYVLVANVRTFEPHSSVARQLFYNNSILAFLPLNDPHLCSIYWSLSLERAKQMKNMETKAFNQMLRVAFDNRLGQCKLESDRQIFPLIKNCIHKFVKHRLILLNNAANIIYPIAGQGMNFNFKDIMELVKELRRLLHEGKDIGQYLCLRRYERSRKYNEIMMLIGIQGIHRMLSGKNLAKNLLRNVSFNFFDMLPALKLQILYQMMGLNYISDCPIYE